MLKRTALFSLAALAISSGALAKGDAAKGKASFATCIACHGPTGAGNKAMNAPRLSGQADWYIVRQLKNFKTKVRGHAKDPIGATMYPFVVALTDQQIEDIAAYITTLK